jgi:hypothetical protein
MTTLNPQPPDDIELSFEYGTHDCRHEIIGVEWSDLYHGIILAKKFAQDRQNKKRFARLDKLQALLTEAWFDAEPYRQLEIPPKLSIVLTHKHTN